MSERREKPPRASRPDWEATTGWSEARRDALILTFTDTSRSESSTRRPSSAVKLVTSQRWWERKGRLWHKLPAVLSVAAIPPQSVSYAARPLSASPRFPCSVATASASPRKAAAV